MALSFYESHEANERYRQQVIAANQWLFDEMERIRAAALNSPYNQVGSVPAGTEARLVWQQPLQLTGPDPKPEDQ